MLALMLHLNYFDGTKTKKLLFSFFCSFYFWIHFNLFSDYRKCPECYGDELCRFFQNRQIQLTWFGYLFSVINPKLTKLVYRGVFNETQVFVKKKLRRLELSDGEIQNVVLCPNVQDARFLYADLKGRLWLNLGTSIEPLLLKYFEPKLEWPVPKYLGACGDLIVEENKGEPLSGFIESDFKTRASLTVELLKMSHLFTFGDPDYAFYFTDYSLDNLVADSLGKVYLVDLDNVIISRRSNDAESMKTSVHKSEILDESNYAFSPSEICSHYLSDHNFFSICKYLLSHPENGFLKVIPTNIKEYAQLMHLLSECAEPKNTANRFSAGRQLQLLLENITDGLTDEIHTSF